MFKKLFMGSAAIAVAAVAIVLVTAVQGTTANAAISGLSVSNSAVNPADATTIITIDADDGAGDVRILATGGDFTACTDAPADAVAGTPDACALTAGAVGGTADIDITVNDAAAANAGGNVDTLRVAWTAPGTGPQSISFTAIQGTSSKSASVTVRGTANAVELKILNGAPTSATVCDGTVANVIRSTTATAANGGLANGTLCAVVTDSAGNRLPNQAVVYSTSAGTVTGLTDTTSATGARAATSTLAAGSTGVSGAEATVTASAGGKTATAKVKFGGDPTSCSITANPTSIQVGGSSAVTVSVMDSSNGPVADGVPVALAQVNPGSGANAAVLGSPGTTSNGTAQFSVIAAIPGAIALGANSPNGAAGATSPVTCTTSLLATGTVAPPSGGNPPAGDGTVTGVVPGKLSIGNGAGTLAELGASAAAQGCNNAVLWLNAPGGGLIGFFPTASLSAPNAAANAAYGTAGYNGGILIDCN